MIDIRNHGALPAGAGQNVAANTAAVQASLNEARLRREGDEVYIPHNTAFDPASIDYGPPAEPTDFRLSGHVYLASTLPVRSYMSVTGHGGSVGAAFLIGKHCRILPDGLAADEPLLRVTGSANHTLEGLWCHRADGGVDIVFDRAAEVVVNKCRFGVLAPGTGPSIIIRDSFWLWFLHCAFGNQANGSTDTTPSVLIENDTSHVWAPGLLEFRDTRFNAGGVELRNAGDPAGWQLYGDMRFDGSIFEVPRAPFLKVGPYCALSSAVFTACSLADANWYGDAIDSPFVLNEGRIGQLVYGRQQDWYDSSTFLAGNPPEFVDFDGGRRPETVVANAPLVPRRERIDGAYDMVLANRGLIEPVISPPGECLPISKDWSGWTKDTPLLEVSGGERDPRGLAGAARVRLVDEAAPALAYLEFFYGVGSPAWVDGEWLVCGAWVRNLSPQPRKFGFMVIVDGSAGWTVDGAKYMINPTLDALAGRDWRPIVRAVKLEKASASAASNPLLSFVLSPYKGEEYHVWRPFGLRLPADMPEYEVGRIVATVTRHASDIAIGHAGTEEDVTFKTGRGSVRPDAAVVGDGAQWFDTELGRPIWAHGGVWVTACGAVAP